MVALACVVVSTLVLVPLQLLAMKTRLWSEWRVLRLWHRVNCRALGFRIHQKGELTDKRPLVVASNHVSWTDISVIGSRCDVSFIAKADMAELAGDGLAVEAAAHDLHRTRAAADVRRAGKRNRAASRRRRSGRAFRRRHDGRRQHDPAVQEHAFRRRNHGDPEGAVDKVYIQPLTIAYTRVQGMPMGRRDRPLAAWIGDTALAPHAAALLSAGAVDVELHFGEAVAFAAGDNRKEATRRAESEVRTMLQEALGNPRPSKA